MQLVVFGVRRSTQLEKSEQNLGHARQHEPTRSKRISGTRSAARSCDNLINALQLLAKQFQESDSVLVEGLQVRSRLKVMEELRKFSQMGNHGAIRIGDLLSCHLAMDPLYQEMQAAWLCEDCWKGGK